MKVWRRSYDIPPPECEPGSPMLPVNDPKYAHLPETHQIKTESLKVESLFYILVNEEIHDILLFFVNSL